MSYILGILGLGHQNHDNEGPLQMVVDLSLPGSGPEPEGAASGFGSLRFGVQLKGSRRNHGAKP